MYIAIKNPDQPKEDLSFSLTISSTSSQEVQLKLNQSEKVEKTHTTLEIKSKEESEKIPQQKVKETLITSQKKVI